MKYLCLSFAIILNFAIFPLLVFAGQPDVGDPMLVLASPFGVGADQIVQAANGAFIGPFQSTYSSIGFSADVNFFEKLHQNGAWLVLDSKVLTQFCGF